MVPETGVGADHNWPQRMTMTTTNVEILRQGWLDAASALAPGLDALPEFLERGLEAAVIDERLDEQSLLRVVTDVTADAAHSLPAEELYFLTRRLQRAVYEYLLSLDALPEPPHRREVSNGHAPQDATLIGAEEVAALGRSGHAKSVEPSHVATVAPEHDPEPAPTADATFEAQTDPDAAATAADRVEAGLAELDAQLSPDEPDVAPEATDEPETETVAGAEAVPDGSPEPAARPAFTLFRRTGAVAKSDKGAPSNNGSAAVVPDATATNGSGAAEDDAGDEDPESFVKPKDGFHLSDLADFAAVQRSAATATPAGDVTPDAEAVEPVAAGEPESSLFTESESEFESEAAPAVPDAPNGAAARGWHLRGDDTDQALEHGLDDPGDNRFETDPEVVEARLEINDRLRRRRCDEAAALLQRLANDVGGRALAELALDAGDRCRALGKGNAALSCYLAASRADPVHETPLLRLADICIDDHDIDLAVSYLERVTRLRRLRNDDKGALKLYRKIVTIAPYRDDILAMLMRAQANGRFDE
ncbi:MAG: hypothetical protein WB808_05955 [Candidatus Dormiibacterota bacterium]